MLGELVHNSAAVVTRWTLDRLEAAWQAFFDRCAKGEKPRFPRYRSFNRWRSFGCSELSDKAFSRPTAKKAKSRAIGFLKIPNLSKPLAVRMHRMLPEGAQVRSCIFTRRGKDWSVALACRLPVTHGCDTDEQLIGIASAEILGFDAGVAYQATDNAGHRYPNVRHGKQRAAEVRRAARRLARAKKGSRNRERDKARFVALKEKEANGRSTASRQNAAALVGQALKNGCRAIAREDLAIRNMMASAAGTVAEPGTGVAAKRSLNRVIADAAMGRFAKDVENKAERAGLRVIRVDPRWTSAKCSACQELVEKPLKGRTYACKSCGLVLDRDHNAAINIGIKAAALYAPLPKKFAKRRGRRSCVSEPESLIPRLGRDSAKLGNSRVSN